MTEILRNLVSVNSVFPNEGELGEYIESLLVDLGFNVSRQEISDNRFNVLAERGERGNPILFYGHMDTVPVYGKWSSDPFELVKRDGRLFGLGVYDMKAGIASILSSLDQSTERRIKVAFGVDEENDSQGAWTLLNSGFLDDVEGIVTTEIGDVSDESVGTRTITLGRRGRTAYEFRVPGRSIHGAHSSGESNALSEASKLAVALEEMNCSLPQHDCLPSATQFVSSINCSATSLSTPSDASLVLERHMVVPETSESILNDLRCFLDELYSTGRLNDANGRAKVSIKQREMPYLMPYLTPREHEFTISFSDAVRSEIGEPKYNYGWSVADECILASTGIPLVSLPPIGGNEHTADEWISQNSYFEMIRVLRRFIKSI